MNFKEFLKFSIPVNYIIPSAIMLIGATFALITYINSEKNDVLSEKYDTYKINYENVNRENIRLKKELKSSNVLVLPSKKIAEQLNDPDISKLEAEVQKLEKQKNDLLNKILDKAVISLDPRSEIANLLEELKSNKPKDVERAISSIFKIHDPILFQPVSNYFVNNRKIAIKAPNPMIYDWYKYLLELDFESGIKIAVNDIGSEDNYVSEAAYSTIVYAMDSKEQIDISIPYIQEVALRENRSTARAKAKSLLYILDNERMEIVDREERIKAREERKKKMEQDLKEAKDHQGPTVHDMLEELLKEVKEIKDNQ